MSWIKRWFQKPLPDPWIEPRAVDEKDHRDAYTALSARLTEVRFLKRSMHSLYVDGATGQHWFSTMLSVNHWSYFQLRPIDAEIAARLRDLPEETDQAMVDQVMLDMKR